MCGWPGGSRSGPSQAKAQATVSAIHLRGGLYHHWQEMISFPMCAVDSQLKLLDLSGLIRGSSISNTRERSMDHWILLLYHRLNFNGSTISTMPRGASPLSSDWHFQLIKCQKWRKLIRLLIFCWLGEDHWNAAGEQCRTSAEWIVIF